MAHEISLSRMNHFKSKISVSIVEELFSIKKNINNQN